jgi:hypothetical protein
MRGHKSPSLLGRLEPPHTPFPHPGRLMGLLCPVILILFSTVDRLGYQFTMSNTITPQFICHDLSGFAVMASQYAPEKPVPPENMIEPFPPAIVAP